MRIDGFADITASMRDNIGELMSRLEPGDQIRAKIIEITSSEAVLRLFDGTVLRAKINDDFSAKPGQVLTFAIASKTEGALFLETVKDISQILNEKPDLIKNILETLKITPDNKNTALTAEFLESSIPVSADNIKKAAELMERFSGLDPGKAAFIVSKGLQDGLSLSKPDLLIKLLSGDIRLSQQIDSLQHAIDAAGMDNLSPGGKNFSQRSLVDLKDSIRELFVKTSSEKLPSMLDPARIQQELNNKLELIKAVVRQAGYTGNKTLGAMAETAARLDDTVLVLNRISLGGLPYFQIPVNISGYNTTAELYVLRRQKNKKKIDPNHVALFISLDTNRLGRVETLLNIKEKNITISMRTENQRISHFIRENIKYLYSALADCGYKLADVRYEVITSATPLPTQEKLLAKMADGSFGKVDLRV